MGRRLGLRCWALARRALMSSAGHLITVQDIMTKYGVCRRTVVRWKQHPDFPPVAMTAADNRASFSSAAVDKWVQQYRYVDVATGRLAGWCVLLDPPERPPELAAYRMVPPLWAGAPLLLRAHPTSTGPGTVTAMVCHAIRPVIQETLDSRTMAIGISTSIPEVVQTDLTAGGALTSVRYSRASGRRSRWRRTRGRSARCRTSARTIHRGWS